MTPEKILVIGGNGQVGTELILRLREIYSPDNVIATDINDANEKLASGGPFQKLDVMDEAAVKELVHKYKPSQVYHLAALLSATAEKNPILGWKLNMDSLLSVLNICLHKEVKKLFWPSSIAVFGPSTPKENTPQNTIMDPDSVYGISKLAGERWCEYYFLKYGLDVRSIRYPGLISHATPPGGGTTDYAVHIFYEALAKGHYTCFLEEKTMLPMLYMPDAVKATIDLMHAPFEQVKVRSSYNLAGFSFSPEQIAEIIKTQLPEFNISYEPDFRQKIAASWPGSIDDTPARKDWGWKPDFSLEAMVKDMLENVSMKIQKV